MLQLALPLQRSEMVIRHSARARRLRVIVNQFGGVEVVVPRRVSAQQVHEFIQLKQPWIDETQSYIQSQRAAHLDSEKPDFIYLAATGQRWDVEYIMGSTCRCKEEPGVTNHHQLRLTLSKESGTISLLSGWLSSKAKQVLIPWLDEVSKETGLPYNEVSIRAQKTRWGSCSAKNNINLNRCLLFLEPRLVRYLMIHELCHTRYLNHSNRFWSLVSKYVPDYQECEAYLDNACYQLPRWAVAN